MKKRRIGPVAGGIAVIAAATVWGLGISIVSSQPDLVRTELPNTGFDAQQGKGRIVARAEWGSGTGQIGCDESTDSRGPQSFGVDDRGRIYVLDNVNRRLVRYEDGHQDAEFPLSGDDYEDVAVSRDRVAVLARTGSRRVSVFDAQAGAIATITVAECIPDIYRLLISDGELLVECPSPTGRTYHTVGTVDGVRASDSDQATARPGGTPSYEGCTLEAAKLSDNDIAVDVENADRTTKVRLRAHSDRDITAILDAVTDQRDNLYLTYGVARASNDVDTEKPEGRIVVARYTAEGELTGRIETKDDYAPEPFRKFVVTESGEVYQLAPDEHGVSVIRWTMDR